MCPNPFTTFLRNRYPPSLPSSLKATSHQFAYPILHSRIKFGVSSILVKGRKYMPILREQPKQRKTALIQARVEEDVKMSLDLYAKFIHSNAAWVVSEALRLLFKKDHDFREWKATLYGQINLASSESEAVAREAKTR